MKYQILCAACMFLILACKPGAVDTLNWTCQKRSFPAGQALVDETMEEEEERLLAAGLLSAKGGADYRALAKKLAAEDAITLSLLGDAFECKSCLWECRFREENEQSPLGLKIRSMQEGLLQEISLATVADQFLQKFDESEWENPLVKFTFLGLVHNLTEANQDKGLNIKLPPWQDGQETETKAKDRNVLRILVNAKGEALVRDEVLPLEQLQDRVKEFISNPNKRSNLADSPRQAIVALSNERSTPYDQYLKVYNTIRAAYQALWDEYARANFGKPYDETLPDSLKRVVKRAIPFVVSEAEPTGFE